LPALARRLMNVLSMKVAIPQWQGRVSPVLDVAERLLVVDLAAGGEVSRQDAALAAAGPLERARQLHQTGAEVLICGAISRPLELALQGTGIQIIPHTCGQVEEVLAAFINGQLDAAGFLMPGCRGRRRRFRAGRRRGGQCWGGWQRGGDSDAQR
jgi:predicted Fe-Mo cluster-binding NifX family protein